MRVLPSTQVADATSASAKHRATREAARCDARRKAAMTGMKHTTKMRLCYSKGQSTQSNTMKASGRLDMTAGTTHMYATRTVIG